MLFQEGLSQQEIEQELCHDITGKILYQHSSSNQLASYPGLPMFFNACEKSLVNLVM